MECGYDNAEGVDSSEEQVATAAKLGVKNVRCEDALALLDRATGEYNCIIALDLIEHLTKTEVLSLLARASTALRPGGVIILQTTNAASPFCGRLRYGDFTHESSFTASSLGQVLRVAGLTEIHVYETPPVIYGVLSFVRAMLWKILHVVYCGLVAVETGDMRGSILTQNILAVARRPVDSQGC
jgi:SAM-dependent methyltransferase